MAESGLSLKKACLLIRLTNSDAQKRIHLLVQVGSAPLPNHRLASAIGGEAGRLTSWSLNSRHRRSAALRRRRPPQPRDAVAEPEVN